MLEITETELAREFSTVSAQAITLRELLLIFFATHDPTTRNRQGNDEGPQYRSAIYTTAPEQA